MIIIRFYLFNDDEILENGGNCLDFTFLFMFFIISQEIKYFFNLKKLQFFISFKEEMLIKVLNYAFFMSSCLIINNIRISIYNKKKRIKSLNLI